VAFPGRLRGRRASWIVGWALLVALGVAGSLFGAEAVAHHRQQKARQSFAQSSADVASLLRLAIQHEQDLVVSAGGFVVADPGASDGAFIRWADAVHALPRYPELSAFGESVVVPAASLAAFASRAVARPEVGLSGGDVFRLTPPGNRALYCFSKLEQLRSGRASLPLGYDYCAGRQGVSVLASRDSGQAASVAMRVGRVSSLVVETPLYRGGVVPATIAARRVAFLGWIDLTLAPGVLLRSALANHPGLVISLRYARGGSSLAFSSGRPPAAADRVVTNIGGEWTVEAAGSLAGAGVLGDPDALALLAAGLALSVSLGLLMLILGSGRRRAVALVSQKTEELRHQALHDPLTGLPNRALVLDRIDRLLARNRRNGTVAGAMYVDLDDFKNLNDTLGHAVGDQLLIAIAARLHIALRNADTIGRLGGDEFVILIEGDDLEATPTLVAERLLEVMRQPFEFAPTTAPLVITVSIGIVVGDRATPDELLRDAGVALTLAKSGGKNRAEVFGEEMNTAARQRYELEFDLRRALEDHQFRLVYQPIYQLDDLTVVGVEALLRWDHPTIGVVQPNEFIPLLESNGQILQVGRWVLCEGCRQMALWHAQGSDVTLSVNVSGRQLESDAVVDDVRAALELSGLPPSMLIVEVTETVLMRDTETASRRLVDLKSLGIHLAVDDFGTGYSSLAYLQRFPVDCLKIDRAFTRAMGESRASRALIRTLVQLGRNLELTILVEGVETTEQVDRLRGEHVDQVQGFLMAGPLDPDVLASSILQLEPEGAAGSRRPGSRPPSPQPVAASSRANPALGRGLGRRGGQSSDPSAPTDDQGSARKRDG